MKQTVNTVWRSNFEGLKFCEFRSFCKIFPILEQQTTQTTNSESSQKTAKNISTKFRPTKYKCHKIQVLSLRLALYKQYLHNYVWDMIFLLVFCKNLHSEKLLQCFFKHSQKFYTRHTIQHNTTSFYPLCMYLYSEHSLSSCGTGIIIFIAEEINLHCSHSWHCTTATCTCGYLPCTIDFSWGFWLCYVLYYTFWGAKL